MTRFSVTMVATDLGIGVADLARAVEERGLDGLWFPDHTHIPLATGPYPLGGELPDRYRRLADPIVSVATAAAVTERIRVGTGVLLPAQRDPIVTAKALATIDQQSGGRLAVGVGYGWNTPEMTHHGVDPATRRGRAREHVLAMRALWENDVAQFDGKHISFGPSWSWPKPVQRPLPVLLGGTPTPKVFGQIAEFGQGWIPVGARNVAEAVPRLRDAFAAAGRAPDTLEIVPFLGPKPVAAKVAALIESGATEVAFDVHPEAAPTVRAALDMIAGIRAEIAG